MLSGWLVIHVWLAFLTLVVEALVGYPAWLHALIPHPVVWAGNAINALERSWNQPQYSAAKRRLLGWLAIVIVAGGALVLGVVVEAGLLFGELLIETGGHYAAAAMKAIASAGPAFGLGATQATSVDPDNPYDLGDGWSPSWSARLALLALVLISTTGLAQRSLFIHVRNVLKALRGGDLPLARGKVSLIVGRDTRQLDTGGVSAAALESLAESFNDGIVAPVFWLALGGLPGLFAYKTLNTADSLIGHKEERWRAFGWAAARADDFANLIPARLAGFLLAFAGWGGLLVMFKDASKHASPNAGWPEAAMAGALGVRLGGPATYDGVVHERPVFGTGPTPAVSDLARGLRIYVIACGLLWLLLGAAELYLQAMR
jgi:adenosylcobinamide-phosphate synthase